MSKSKKINEFNKPTTDNNRILCCMLGSAMGYNIKEFDGVEYAVAHEEGNDVFFYNPMASGEEALELLEEGNFGLVPAEHSLSKEDLDKGIKWLCVVGKQMVPGRTVNEAICLGTYHFLVQQAEGKKESVILTPPEKKIIIAQ